MREIRGKVLWVRAATFCFLFLGFNVNPSRVEARIFFQAQTPHFAIEFHDSVFNRSRWNSEVQFERNQVLTQELVNPLLEALQRTDADTRTLQLIQKIVINNFVADSVGLHASVRFHFNTGVEYAFTWGSPGPDATFEQEVRSLADHLRYVAGYQARIAHPLQMQNEMNNLRIFIQWIIDSYPTQAALIQEMRVLLSELQVDPISPSTRTGHLNAWIQAAMPRFTRVWPRLREILQSRGLSYQQLAEYFVTVAENRNPIFEIFAPHDEFTRRTLLRVAGSFPNFRDRLRLFAAIATQLEGKIQVHIATAAPTPTAATTTLLVSMQFPPLSPDVVNETFGLSDRERSRFFRIEIPNSPDWIPHSFMELLESETNQLESELWPLVQLSRGETPLVECRWALRRNHHSPPPLPRPTQRRS